jgi:hypothetical protein
MSITLLTVYVTKKEEFVGSPHENTVIISKPKQAPLSKVV